MRIAVELMQRSGISLPTICEDWIETDIPKYGELEGGVPYFKHGYGCEVDLPTGSVDFDFGKMGEIDGFDVWRLMKFAGAKLTIYGFESREAVEKSFNAAVKSGSVVSSGYILYYVADSVRSLAIEISKDFPNDSLPHRDQDTVMVLYTKCFLAADLMRKNHEKLSQKWERKGALHQNEQVECEIYFLTWLAYLSATCEGFDKLSMRALLEKKRPQNFRDLISRCDDIGKLRKQHLKSLKEFRNNVFHLRDDIKPILRFAVNDGGRLTWAHELHLAIAEFLSKYRVLCEIHYLTQRRRSEGQLGKIPSKRRNK